MHAVCDVLEPFFSMCLLISCRDYWDYAVLRMPLHMPVLRPRLLPRRVKNEMWAGPRARGEHGWAAYLV